MANEPTPRDAGGELDCGDRNVENLIQRVYQPERPDPEFARRVEDLMCRAARDCAEERARQALPRASEPESFAGWAPFLGVRQRLAWVLSLAALLACIFLPLSSLFRFTPERQAASPRRQQPRETNPAYDRLSARPRPAPVPAPRLDVGQTLATKANERHRLALPDGSLLFLNQNSQVKLEDDRRLSLVRGEAFVEVAPYMEGERRQPFVVRTPDRECIALGTKFVVCAEPAGTGVVVSQGKVKVNGLVHPLTAGQQLAAGSNQISPAPRISYVLDWTKDLVAQAESPLVPATHYAGGALVAVDPDGQEMNLSLRKYHIDVHVEDGFARTTIDQTYFNHNTRRLEGTFYFPLPPDASLSRLAMYVDGNLMEGGMAERDHARNVYETIVHSQRDPALLEWVDGSTFKMRVFPLEGRQEKRIVLGYTQKLETLYGRAHYQFPAGHSFQQVRDWSFHALVKNAVATAWSSDSHALKETKNSADLVLDAEAKNVKPDRDVSLYLHDSPLAVAAGARFSSAEHEGAKYLMLRYRLLNALRSEDSASRLTVSPLTPHPSPLTPHPSPITTHHSPLTTHQPRNWVFLFESSGERDPLLARAQIEVIRTLLHNIEHDDTFAIVTAGTRVRTFPSNPEQQNSDHFPGSNLGGTPGVFDGRGSGRACTPRPSKTQGVPPGARLPASLENIQAGIDFLEHAHLIGALDLKQALLAVQPFVKNTNRETYLVHVGAGIATLGERREDVLVSCIPEGACYVGVGVGKRWSRSFMKAGAERSGGTFTQINPDEPISWRAFALYSTLFAPRLLDVRVTDGAGKAVFLNHAGMVAEGEELCAVARLDASADPPLPATVVVTGRLDDQPFRREIPVENVAEGAGYLPRTWARLEIDRLLLDDSAKNKQEIVALSKAMYVMTPYTSLLVLENEEMYKQYNVDRGRKDHWAMYPCPPRIPVVHEPEPAKPGATAAANKGDDKKTVEQVLDTILVRASPRFLKWEEQQYKPPGFMDDFAPARFITGADFLVNSSNRDAVSVAGGSSIVVTGTAADFPSFNVTGGVSYSGTGGTITTSPAVYQIFSGTHPTPDPLAYLPTFGIRLLKERDPIYPDEYKRLTYGKNGANNNGAIRLDGQENRYGQSGGGWSYRGPWKEGMVLSALWDTDRAGPFGDRYEIDELPPARVGQFTIVGNEVTRQNVVLRQVPLYPGQILSYPDLRLAEKNLANSFIFDSFDIQEEDASAQLIRLIVQIVGKPEDWAPIQQPISGGQFQFGGLEGVLPSEKRAYALQTSTRPAAGDFILPGSRVDVIHTMRLQKNETFSRYLLQDVLVRAVDMPTNVRPDDRPGNLNPQFSQSRILGLANLRSDDRPSLISPITTLEVTSEQAIILSRAEQTGTITLALRLYEYEEDREPPQRHYFDASSLLYQRPSFSNDDRIFYDLVSHAPGMNTSAADIQAVLEAELGSKENTAAGPIDPAARVLIERARSAGWRSLAIPAAGARPGFSLAFDGQGRYAHERTLPSGLHERVVCDGKTLLSLYPELGIGARRTVSRFHRAEIASLIPWLLPAVEDLARFADVKCLDERTVVLSPRGAENAKTDDGKPVKYLCTHLVFAETGRLAERRVVHMPSQKTLYRATYSPEGVVKLLDGADKELFAQSFALSASSAPDLAPDTKELVVLPLPLRTLDQVRQSRKLAPAAKYEEMDFDSALALFAAACASNNESEALQIFEKCFYNRGRRQLGFYTLLAARGVNLDPDQLSLKVSKRETDKPETVEAVLQAPATYRNVLSVHPRAPLARYLAFHSNPEHRRRAHLGIMPGPEDGFLQRLASLRVMEHYWRTGSAQNDKEPNRQLERDKALAFIRRHKTSLPGWALLDALQTHATGDDAFHLALAEAFGNFERVPGLAYAARYERARALLQAGRGQQAQDLFRELYAKVLAEGILPPIDRSFREALTGDGQGQDPWSGLMRRTAHKLVADRDRLAAVALAQQCRRLDDPALAEELLALALDGITAPRERLLVTLAGVRFHQDAGKPGRAEALVQALLQDERFARLSYLWRLAAKLAQTRENKEAVVPYLEKALDIEFQKLPEVIDLQSVRADYGALLSHYRQIAGALATLSLEAPADFVARVVRAADRWRLLDREKNAEACQEAARILKLVGARDLAWDYLTTPIGQRPNESDPWLGLARELSNEGEPLLADRAYAAAFEAEPTNAQILWDRAENLRQAGKPDAARALYRQLAAGDWQPRFAWIKNQAQKQ